MRERSRNNRTRDKNKDAQGRGYSADLDSPRLHNDMEVGKGEKGWGVGPMSLSHRATTISSNYKSVRGTLLHP